MLLAGDAAHQMPPFAGQGMCSGIRDAVTLDWHLDLVLKGQAHEQTLDAYTSERRGHLQHAIALSVELGKVICIADEAEAAARDEVLLGVAADPSTPPGEPPPPNLGPGIHDGAGAAGSLFPQGRMNGQLVEDTFEAGFALYVLAPELVEEDDRRRRSPGSAAASYPSARPTSASTTTGSPRKTARPRSCGRTSTCSERPRTARGRARSWAGSNTHWQTRIESRRDSQREHHQTRFPPLQPQDDAPAGDGRLVRDRGRLRGHLQGRDRRLADQRRGQPPHRAAGASRASSTTRTRKRTRAFTTARSSTAASRS